MSKPNNQKQKEYKERRWAEILKMPQILCECGCGTMIPPFTRQFKPARFAHGHNQDGVKTRFKKGQDAWNKGLPSPWSVETHTGKKKLPESTAKRTATRLVNNGGVYQTAKGWKHTPNTIDNMKTANRAKAKFGEENHFFGKRHSKESKAKISAANSGANNVAWRGGVSTLPYGPEFTRAFKRIIRIRDQYTCQRCGIVQAEHKRTLQIHHIDFDKNNNDPSNLVTACNKCNIWANYHPNEPFINPEVWERTHPKTPG